MPRIVRPNSVRSRYFALENFLQTKNAISPEYWPCSVSTVQQIEAFFPIYKDAIQKYSAAKGRQGTIVHSDAPHPERTTAAKYVRAYFNTLFLAIELGFVSQSEVSLFGISLNKPRIPRPRTEGDVYFWLQKIVQVETFRIGQGRYAIPIPSLAQCQAVFNDKTSQIGEKSNAKDNKGERLTELRNLSKQADSLIRDAWDEIEFANRKHRPARKRRRSKLWGVVYKPTKRKHDTNDVTESA